MTFINPVLLPKVRSDGVMAFAAGQSCALRLPGICNHDRATTVMGHLPHPGKGVGTKGSDIHAAFVCSACHVAIDTHAYEKHGLTAAVVLDAMLRGLAETQGHMLAAGLIVVPDGELI